MTQMNPFAKSALAFVILFAIAIVVSYVLDVFVKNVTFQLDLATAMGIAAGGAVMLLVHELTKENN